VPVPTVPKEVPVKVRPASFKLDSKLTMTNKLAMPTKLAKTIAPAKTNKRSSAQISSH
jgi:hypothetical protein